MRFWTSERSIFSLQWYNKFTVKHAVTWQHFFTHPYFIKVEASRAVAALVAELKQCSYKKDLQQGRIAHLKAIQSGLNDNKYVANTLITMYSRCGSMQDAWEAFMCMSSPDVVSWNALIHGYAENEKYLTALELFACMDCSRTAVTFVGAFKACAALASGSTRERMGLLEIGSAIQREAAVLGFVQDMFVASSLVDMYSKCGDVKRAREVFDGMVQRNVISWNALIHGYVDNREAATALEIFCRMNCEPDGVTIVAALRACSLMVLQCNLDKGTCLRKGSHIHRLARHLGLEKDVSVANTLVDMYSKCGNMELARQVFDGMVQRNVVTWTALVLGYVVNGNCSMGLKLLDSMDCSPDSVTFVAAVKACTGLLTENKLPKETCLRRAVSTHWRAHELGFDKDIIVAGGLVDMYSKFGEMRQAQSIFDSMRQRNVVVWNTLILGYVENGEGLRALDLFHSMDHAPDRVTFVSALKACAALGTSGEHLDRKTVLQKGVIVHKLAGNLGFQEDTMVANSLIDMYSKCGDMKRARDVFDGMVQRDVISWTSIMLGYIENGEGSVALCLFKRMDCAPNSVTFAAALKACSCLGALENGREIHDRICELGLEQDQRLANCLVDLYGKCGDTDAAEKVFTQMKSWDVVSWNALIGGYSLRGDAPRVFNLLKRMQDNGMQMNSVTTSLVLTACSYAGMVEEGKMFFESMHKHGVYPAVEHYNGLVDLLGRANRLEEAVSVINEMALEADAVTWKTLLSLCRQWNNSQIAKAAFDALVSLGNPSDIEFATVLMRDIYRTPRNNEKA